MSPRRPGRQGYGVWCRSGSQDTEFGAGPGRQDTEFGGGPDARDTEFGAGPGCQDTEFGAGLDVRIRSLVAVRTLEIWSSALRRPGRLRLMLTAALLQAVGYIERTEKNITCSTCAEYECCMLSAGQRMAASRLDLVYGEHLYVTD